jgi:hypothetical protein
MKLSPIFGLPIAEPDDARRDFPTQVDDPRTIGIEAGLVRGGPVFANAAARDSAIPAPAFGMVCQLQGTRQRHNGYVWVGDASLASLAMSNGWTGASHAAIDADGNVELHLYAAHTGATSVTLCTLPAKYWPIAGYLTLRFPAYCTNGTAREIVGLTVSAAGVVSFGWPSGSYSTVVHVDAIVSYRGAFLAVR